MGRDPLDEGEEREKEIAMWYRYRGLFKRPKQCLEPGLGGHLGAHLTLVLVLHTTGHVSEHTYEAYI